MHSCAFYFFIKYYKSQHFFNYIAVPEGFFCFSLALKDIPVRIVHNVGVISVYQILNTEECEVCFSPLEKYQFLKN